MGKGLAFFAQTGFNHPDPQRTAFFTYHPSRRKITMAKAATSTKPLTKTELLANIATATELPKTQVAAVLEALAAEIQKSLGNKGAGMITIPGLVKIEKKKVSARPAQKGVPNPFKPGELMDRPAKPAYNKVKVRALKLLKDMAK
jgi:nucleoid DNA-binding protein